MTLSRNHPAPSQAQDAAPNTYPDLRIGLLGRGIQASRTPRMHMNEGAAQGQNIRYDLLDADLEPAQTFCLKTRIEAAENSGYAGLNVTYPFKMEVLPLLDVLSTRARAVGAVNTIVFRDGKRFGHNTDMWGFQESFRQNMADVKRTHVLQIGTGGAGVAVAHALVALGVERLSLADTDLPKAQHLSAQISRVAPHIRVEVIPLNEIATCAPDGVVNATPMGMEKLPGSAYPVALLHADIWVADIVYFPLETALLAAARAAGCPVLAGSGMAVFQAVRAYTLFTGRAPDPARMKATFEAFS
jgi:shikimate dehydrogenase